MPAAHHTHASPSSAAPPYALYLVAHQAHGAHRQAPLKQRIVRAFVKRRLLDSIDGEVMLLARHGGGFSVDASVCIVSDDWAELERLLRYCARPPFAMERPHRKGQDHLLYHCPKPQSGGKQGDLILTPCEFIAKIAALVPPPRTHRHRYFCVLAQNSPLRAVVTAIAPMPESTSIAQPVVRHGLSVVRH